ncbi:hypothetical protein F1D05_10820 [Kribbella qitaiheensis]|uniref:Uncharacterized protein n=1 Tax=Kribbella qitaiheensis TaxID=1544730 RepID=A0A7G6WWD0_9ACTN|nr:hypothetical protein [Kribbella qitaiheensis]QNE18295.1 hypothetical protein F1D05_10820 [Kribbella qitaiheensis]
MRGCPGEAGPDPRGLALLGEVDDGNEFRQQGSQHRVGCVSDVVSAELLDGAFDQFHPGPGHGAGRQHVVGVSAQPVNGLQKVRWQRSVFASGKLAKKLPEVGTERSQTIRLAARCGHRLRLLQQLGCGGSRAHRGERDAVAG